MDHIVDSYIQQFRTRAQRPFDDVRLQARRAQASFQNPTPDNPVDAARFLHHLRLDHPRILSGLRSYSPYVERDRMLPRLASLLKWFVWAILKGHPNPHRARLALQADEQAQRLLGFREPGSWERLPCYDAMNDFWKWLTTPTVAQPLLDAFVLALHALVPDLGTNQVEDATPYRSRRVDETAPYNDHYKCRMHKTEARWDPDCGAFLVGALAFGVQNEGCWSVPLTRRVQRLGLPLEHVTVDGGYPSYDAIARHHQRGVQLGYKPQEHWSVDPAGAEQEVRKRYNHHWRVPGYRPGARVPFQANFLLQAGSGPDREAAAKWLRDAYLTTRPPREVERVAFDRARNEGLHPELHRVRLEPDRRGLRRMVQLTMGAFLSLHAIQLTRAQHGVRHGLCLTGSIL